jgi:ribosome-binding factor A
MSSRSKSRRSYGTNRDYPRTARLNQLLREILAEEVERIDDERLELLTIISVEAEADLRKAVVYYDSLGGEATDDATLLALTEARIRLQAAIGRQAHVKHVPELSFAPDPAVRAGERIDAILREIGPLPDDDAGDVDDRGDEVAPGAGDG